MPRRVLAVLVSVVFAGAFLGYGASSAASPLIQPGAPITTGTANCTLNWIYDGTGARTGKMYGGTAAHCVDQIGQRISLNEAGGASFGSVAFMFDGLDYALIEIDAGQLTNVNPAMRGHPDIPQGVSTVSTAAVGDVMQFSGFGDGVNLTESTREERIGVLGFNDGQQHFIYGVVTPGDSGGPVADITDGNKAFGIVLAVGAAITPVPQIGEAGTSLEGLLAHAAASGFPVRVRTVGATSTDDPPAGGGDSGSSVDVGDSNAGRKGACRFTITVEPPASQEVTVDYATEDADGDAAFTQKIGTLTFASGEASKTVTVAVKHRRRSEIELALSDASGAAIEDGSGVCRIGKKQKKR